MPSRELYSGIKCENALNVQIINTDTDTAGAIIDMQDHDSILWNIIAGTIVAGVATPKLEVGDVANLSDAVDAPDSDLTNLESTAVFTGAGDSNKVKVIGYTGNKRYGRLTITSSASANLTMGASVNKGHSDKAPVINNA